MWQKLVENSLIGTAKLKLQKEEFPSLLIEMIDKTSLAEEESLFLQVASSACLYLEAGAMPPVFNGIMDDSKFEETKAYAARNFMKILDSIFESNRYLDKEYLLQFWLKKLLKNNWIVDSSYINPLLELGNKLSIETQKGICEAIGKKGAWLLSIRNDLNYELSADSNIWDEGDNNQRKVLFENLRKTTPKEAMTLLDKTWQTESITTKRSFLETINNTLQRDDFEFLENLWKYDFIAKVNEKETERQCRASVINMLLKFPESEIYQQFEKSFAPYIQKKKKSGFVSFVTGKEELFIDLPEEEDYFWSKSNMLSTFGILTDPSQTAIFPTLSSYWFYCLVETLPFQFWTSTLEKNTAETLNYFVSVEQFIIKTEGVKQSFLLGPIIQNAIQSKDQYLITALFPIISKEDATPLLSAASTEHFEAYVSKNKLWIDPQAISQRLNIEEKWSIGFSKEMVRKVFEESVKNNQYVPEYIAKLCTKSMHKSAFDFLEKADEDINNYQAKHYQKVFYEPLSLFKDIITKTENYA